MKIEFLFTKLIRVIIISLLFSSAVVLLTSAVFSLNWRYFHDTPILIYCAYLIDSGFIPYTDFFDMNMPGVYFVYFFAAKIFGWSDLSFRVFDILYLAALLFFTIVWLKPFGKITSISAGILFGLYYLDEINFLILQREYIALLPFVMMLALFNYNDKVNKMKVLFLSGILIGGSFLIKPQFIFFSLTAAGYFVYQNRERIRIRNQIKYLLSGFFIPVIAIISYLIYTGSLNSFLEIVVNYWQLYRNMNGDHQILEGFQKISYNLKSLFIGLNVYILPLAFLGILVFNLQNPKNKHSRLLLLLLISSMLYPLISGQFFDYHWMPFYYIAICAAVNIVELPSQNLTIKNIVLFFATLCLFVPILKSNIGYTYNYEKNKVALQRTMFQMTDEISSFLKDNLKEGDKVQPLDWTVGAVHAMLKADAKIATRFIYDFHFYHHINSPFIIKLKKEFIEELNHSRPEFVIQVLENWPRPQGNNTSRDFVELKNFLEQNYNVAKEGDGYRIYKFIK